MDTSGPGRSGQGEIERMEYPPLSLDMNPIEYVWDYLSRLIWRLLNHLMSTPNQLWAAVEE